MWADERDRALFTTATALRGLAVTFREAFARYFGRRAEGARVERGTGDNGRVGRGVSHSRGR
jgi:hypothetical protein